MTYADFKPRVKAGVESIKKSQEITEENKALLLDFVRDQRVKGLSDARIHKLLTHLRPIARRLDKGFEETSEDDIKDIIAWVRERDLADSTKRDYKVVLKKFYKWLNDGEYPEKVDWIKTTRKNNNHKLPEDLYTEEDVEKLIETAENPRDKAFIALLWETGARIGEIINLKVSSFEDREHGKKVVVRGKTGARRLPVISSIPQLQNWLNNHPRKEDPEAPLWCRLNGKKAGEQVSYRYLTKMLKKTAGKADIDKPANPHHFRHSRATYLANRLTESQLSEWFGWVQGSDRPATYVHLSGREIDLKYDQLHGIETEEEPEKSQLSPKECPRCGAKNEPNASFCQNCGQALTREAFERVEEEERKTESVLSEIVSRDEAERIVEAAKKIVEGK